MAQHPFRLLRLERKLLRVDVLRNGTGATQFYTTDGRASLVHEPVLVGGSWPSRAGQWETVLRGNFIGKTSHKLAGYDPAGQSVCYYQFVPHRSEQFPVEALSGYSGNAKHLRGSSARAGDLRADESALCVAGHMREIHSTSAVEHSKPQLEGLETILPSDLPEDFG